jgi:hypothetical protein
MFNKLQPAAVTTLVCLTPSWVFGADFDTRKPLTCATIDAHFRDIGETYYRTLPSILGAPQFSRVNIAKKTIAASQRSTEIRFMTVGDGQLLLQGTEFGYGWSLVIDTKSGAMSTTLVNREDVFVLFGAYTSS